MLKLALSQQTSTKKFEFIFTLLEVFFVFVCLFRKLLIINIAESKYIKYVLHFKKGCNH